MRVLLFSGADRDGEEEVLSGAEGSREDIREEDVLSGTEGYSEGVTWVCQHSLGWEGIFSRAEWGLRGRREFLCVELKRSKTRK